ncbi:hypothetical protein [Rahnella perminowiae]|uniref:hypothetical protein n=1 Tax=Rahnella perminowiae TaxID=2816244 RepID=UPI00215C4C6A|nr:hypothetical protein [Rahnella perminowiae]MCR9000972.1 hypothetical protein [Rahnella perminowiae]
MQYVDRSQVLPPSGLVTDSHVKENLYEIEAFLALDPQRRAQTRPPRLASVDKVAGLKDAVYKLFDGRCAFCECQGHSLSIQRFRPGSNATPMEKKLRRRFITSGLPGRGKIFILLATVVMH